mmetsp:Transcript_5699/g.11315  ORF Transcript_5699/g.11315 Transcript_5699/m.11315 type:complete len:237 (-) Transcript_5699:392-1102(-)
MKLQGAAVMDVASQHFMQTGTDTMGALVARSIETVGGQPIEGCTLVESSFDIAIQAVLGFLAFMSLVLKRYLESPRRPMKIWFFDASKQAFAGLTVHWLNIAIAEFLTHGGDSSDLKSDECDFYFVNFVIDVVVGVSITYLLLEVVQMLAEKYDIPSLRTGEYGDPPKINVWLLQLSIFMAITVVIKFALFLTEMNLRYYLDLWGYTMFQSADPYPKVTISWTFTVMHRRGTILRS